MTVEQCHQERSARLCLARDKTGAFLERQFVNHERRLQQLQVK